MPDSPIPCVIYAAKSSPDPNDSTGSQVKAVRAAISQAGGRSESADPFTEENVSGYQGSRGPQLDGAIAAAAAAARRHGHAELWVFHSSRLGRGDGFGPDAARSLVEVIVACNRAGVRVRSVQDDAFVSSPMLAGIASEQNHKYSADLAANVRRGKQAQLERGERLGGKIPDGYVLRVIRDDRDRVTAREYSFDPGREPIIRRMFELALEGHGSPAVARLLNAEGHRKDTGRPWDRRGVQDKLKNPFYAGLSSQRGEKTGPRKYEVFAEPRIAGEGGWPGVVTREEWERIQADIKQRDCPARCRRPEGQRTLRFALARLGVCDRCGERMYVHTSPYLRKDGTRARRYLCGNVKNGTGVCDQPPIDAVKVDAAVVRHLNTLFVDFDEWLKQLASGVRRQRESLEAELRTALDAQARAAKQEVKLRDRYVAAVENGDEVRETAAFEAYQHVVGQRETHQARVRDLQEALAAEPAQPSTDAMLDVYADLARTVRESSGGGLGEVNDRMRAVFAEFRLDQVEPGVIGILPVLRAEVVDRYADVLPMLRGPSGAKSGEPLLPPTSPTAIFTDGVESDPTAQVPTTLVCGHVGCCDSSPARHASAHAKATGHPLIRSIEPGETWAWCFVDEVGLNLPQVHGEPRIPPSPLA